MRGGGVLGMGVFLGALVPWCEMQLRDLTRRHKGTKGGEGLRGRGVLVMGVFLGALV